MFLNFLTIAHRSLFRRKMFSLINIAGLAIGIAASLLLFRYISFELSYDAFHVNGDHVYRLRHDVYKEGNLDASSAISYYGAAPAIQESFPEVTNFVRLHRADGMINHHTDRGDLVSYYETCAFYADTSFFSVFSFPLIKGDKNKVLRNSASVVLSESAARKYFGDDNPLGKVVSLTSEWQGGEYVVDGVFKDIPENSHMKFDFLFAIEKLLVNPQFKNGSWYWTNFYSYLVLRPGTDPLALERKLPVVIDNHLGSYLKKINAGEKFILQPLRGIYLNSNLGAEIKVNGDSKMLSFLFIISLFILGIAWVNFINLSSAKATERAREVGTRKVLGSTKVQLIKQFLVESAALVLVSMLVAAILMFVAIPYFDALVGKEIKSDLASQAWFWMVALAVVLAGTLVSTLYPAFVIASFHPLEAIKGKQGKSIGGIRSRQAMVVFQFGASILLMIATVTIYRQLEFMRSQELGMNINKKVVIRAPKIIQGESFLNEIETFKNEVKGVSEVSHVAASSEVPGKQIFWSNEFRKKSDPDNVRKLLNILAVDDDFIPAYELKILAGRNFSKTRVSDFGSAVVINESAVRLLGFENPEAAIGREIVSGADLKTIVGVIRDFHQQSLLQANGPIVIYYIPWRQDFLTLSVNGDVKDALATIKGIFHDTFPGNAFDYFFLDDQFNRQYLSDERSWKIFVLFSVLAIVVACMGLFGLASFVVTRRSKEIALRKILGASVANVALMLTNDFIRLVVIAFLMAVPLSWIFIDAWLRDFAYRVNIPWWTFIPAGVLAGLIALLTVGFHSIKVAMTNPIKAITTE